MASLWSSLFKNKNTKANELTEKLNKTTHSQGKIAEELALTRLQQAGLEHVESNFYSRFGEIDLVMIEPGKTDYLVFIEVRYRKNQSYGAAIESIDTKKQQKLIKTAEYYLLKNPIAQKYPIRFDVVLLSSIDKLNVDLSKQINWIKNAF